MVLHNEKPKIAIIGAGNVGTGLAHALANYGYSVTLGTRKLKHAQPKQHANLNLFANAIHMTSYVDALRNAKYVLVTVPDDTLLSNFLKLSKYLPSNIAVAHCSGALSSDVLASARKKGCSVASLHPLNTFPNKDSAIETLRDNNHKTTLYCEGDASALDQFIPIFENVGFIPKKIKKSAKPLYHAACVFACNLLTALVESSLKTAELAQLDRDELWESLQPLVNRTINNINENGTANALSGPIARGDYRTIEHHIKLLESKQPALAAIYKSLSLQAIDLTEQRGLTDAEVLYKMRKVTRH